MTTPISGTTGATPAPSGFQPPDLNALTRSQGSAAISALITNTALVQSLFPNPSLFPAPAAPPAPANDPIDGLLQSAFTYQLASSGNSAALRMLLGQQPGQVIDTTA